MERLFVETEQELIPIDDAIVDKYDLKEGTCTPFTNQRIVDKDGNFFHEEVEEKHTTLPNQDSDEISEMDHGLMLSTSEMLDIAEGADSYPDANQDD
jgi:hypothetical protein